ANIHLVDALVAEVAVAVIPEPVPVIVKALAHGRLERGRTTPEIIVHRGRLCLWPIHLADAGPRLVAQAACHLDLAQLARAKEVDGLAHAGHAPALGAGLADAL